MRQDFWIISGRQAFDMSLAVSTQHAQRVKEFLHVVCLQMEEVLHHCPDGKVIRKRNSNFGVAYYEKTNMIVTKTMDN